MRILLAVVLTAIVTAVVTYFVTQHTEHERFAQLLWVKCPQVIINPHDPEVAFIEMHDGGYLPIMPRPRKQPAN